MFLPNYQRWNNIKSKRFNRSSPMSMVSPKKVNTFTMLILNQQNKRVKMFRLRKLLRSLKSSNTLKIRRLDIHQITLQLTKDTAMMVIYKMSTSRWQLKFLMVKNLKPTLFIPLNMMVRHTFKGLPWQCQDLVMWLRGEIIIDQLLNSSEDNSLIQSRILRSISITKSFKLQSFMLLFLSL